MMRAKLLNIVDTKRSVPLGGDYFVCPHIGQLTPSHVLKARGRVEGAICSHATGHMTLLRAENAQIGWRREYE